MIAGGIIAVMGLVPGMPKLPFFVIGGIFFLLGRAMKAQFERDAHAAATAVETAPAPQPGDVAIGALSIDPLELTIGFGLVPLVDQKAGGSLLARVGVVRRQIATELGMVIAPVRIHDDVTLDSHEYAIKVRGGEVARDADHPRPPPGDEPGRRRTGDRGHRHGRAGVRPARRLDRGRARAPRRRRSATRSSTPSR